MVGYPYAKPVNNVRVGRVAGAAGELLLAGGAHGDRVVHGALAARIERPHVEDVDTLHLSENLETLETSGLLEVGGNGTGLGTRAEKVVIALDLCMISIQSASNNEQNGYCSE